MANVLGLALKISADASQLKLTPVERALQTLGAEAAKVTSIFDQFTSGSAAAQRSQQQFATDLGFLNSALKTGQITAQEFAEEFANLAEAAQGEADALREAARITESVRSPLERFQQSAGTLQSQLNAGRITQETYNRALEQAAKGLTAADRAAAGLAAQTEQVSKAGRESTLQFNELSGIFAVLPGPLGNIAGRFSGIASASEGLSRIFAGGFQTGITNLIGSFTSLINPVSAALAGITALATGGAAVARGLIELEDRVESLGNIADKLGVSFGFIQTLEESAKRSGTSVDAVSAAFGRLQKSVLGVDEESKAAQKALAEIGVTSQELQELSPEDQYRRIGEALAAIEDPARRTATATALFGKSGSDLLPFFRNLETATADIERFGRALTEIDRGRIDDFGAGLDALGVATQGLGQSLLLPFAGLGEGVASAFAEVTAGLTAVIDPIGQVLEPLLTQVGRIIELIGANVGNLGRTIGAVFEPFATVVQAVSQAITPLQESLFALLRSIGDGTVIVTEFIVSFTPIGAIAENAGALGETIGRVGTIILTAFSRATEAIGLLVSSVASFLAQSPLLQRIGDTITSIFGNISNVFSTIANAIGGVVGRLLTLAEEFLGIDRAAASAAASAGALGSEIQALTEEEQAQAAERDKFLQGFRDSVSKAIDESANFGQAGFDAALQYQNAIAELQRQFDAGILNEEAFKRAADQANESYEQQIETLKQAAQEIDRKAKAEEDAARRAADAAEQSARRQQDSDQKRIDSLLATSDATSKITEDLAAVEREIARVQQEIAETGTTGSEDRLNQLQALQGQLEEQLQAAAQGFEQGFDKAFAATGQNFARLAEQANEFGQAGIDAAARLQEGIAAAQEQARDGILNREAFEAEVARRQQLFEQEIEQVKQVADERKRVNDFVDQQFMLARFGGDQQRLEAANRVAEIEREIIRVQGEVQAARANGDQAAVNAGIQRLGLLDQVGAKEANIASGRQQLEQQIAQQRDQYLKQLEEQQKQAQQQQQAFLQQQQKALEAEQARQTERLRELNTLGAGVIEGKDIRTSEGAALFLQLAAQQQDPALIEARLQTKALYELRNNTRLLVEGLTGLPTVRIPGALG